MITSIKCIIYLFIFVFTISSCHSQNKSINLIVIVNDKLEIGAINNTRLKIVNMDGAIEVFKVTYYPGDLIIPEIVLDKLKNKYVKYFYILMDHYEYCGEETIIHNYDLQMYPAWLEQPFLVFRFYNMDKERIRKRFDPLEGKDYTYEVDLASNSILRARKMGDMDDCK